MHIAAWFVAACYIWEVVYEGDLNSILPSELITSSVQFRNLAELFQPETLVLVTEDHPEVYVTWRQRKVLIMLGAAEGISTALDLLFAVLGHKMMLFTSLRAFAYRIMMC